MSLTKFTGDVDNIQSLADQPTETASQLKALFDKAGADIKTFINNTLTSEVDTALGTKANSSNVYNKTEADERYELSSNLAVVNVTFSSDTVTVSYPTGFSISNCIIVGATGVDLGGSSITVTDIDNPTTSAIGAKLGVSDIIIKRNSNSINKGFVSLMKIS